MTHKVVKPKKPDEKQDEFSIYIRNASNMFCNT